MKKIISLVFVLLLIFSLVGCASKSESNDLIISESVNNSGFNYDYSEGGFYEEIAKPEENLSNFQNNEISTTQKFITTYRFAIETKNYDSSMSDIKESVANLNGYIESESSYDYGKNRNTELVLRIPTKNINEWLDKVNNYGTITSKNQKTENVTLQYVDIEGRLNSFKAERDALISLMERAETVEDLVIIQSQLTNISYEIESYESRLRSLSDLIDYTTITLSLEEVEQETTINPTFFDKVKETFNESIDNLVDFSESFTVFIIGRSPILLIWIIVVVICFIVIKKIRKRSKVKKEKKVEIKNQTEIKETKKDNN